VAESFQYLELWTKLQAQGGTRSGFFLPINPRRRLGLKGEDSLTFAIPKTHALADSFTKLRAVREILSADGATWREWLVDRTTRASGDELLVTVECFAPLRLLANYPVTTTDADGYVYRDTPAIQLSPTNVITSFLRSNTPSWIETGTVTPTALTEVPFAGDSALSGARRLEEVVPGYEVSLEPDGTTAYDLNFTARGASAATLYLRTAKNIQAMRKEVIPGQITRLTQISGADGDEGPSGIAWAYWEVVSTSGAGPYNVVLQAIHGGDGPIAFDDQLNHANLPGGANSLYMRKRDGTYTQITDSIASSQTIVVASITNVSAGDWVRIVASSTGKHLSSLDAPTEIAATGVLAGRYESGWDDAVCVVKNALQESWPSTLPASWTGVGTKTTTAGEWLTSGAALSINSSYYDLQQLAAPPARSWYIEPRRTVWSAVAWIRMRAAGEVALRVKVGSTVIGAPLVYASPLNAWRQLKLEGLDLSAYQGTTVTLTVEIVKWTAGTANLLVDSICLSPSVSARGVTTGSNAARIWQGANAFLDVQRADQVSYQGTIADLDRMGRTNQQPVVIGGAVVVADDEFDTVTARVVEVEDTPGDPRSAQVTIATLPPRFSRQQSKPLELVIPYFEPIQVRAADRDTRNAALSITASITAQDDTTVTVQLAVADTLGASPSVAYAVFGAAYSSGSGSGPYVFTKPTAGNGLGRAVFTASLAGRTEVYDAVDIPESSAPGPSLTLQTTPGSTSYSIAYTASGGTVEVSIDGGSFSAAGASPVVVARSAVGGADKVYTFRVAGTSQTVTDSVTIPAQDLLVGPSLELTVTPGSTSYSIAYTKTGTLETSLDGASFAAAAASPIVVSRNAVGGADKVLTFRCTQNGQTIGDAVVVLVQATAPGGTVPPSIDAFYSTGVDTTNNEVDLAWAASNEPASETYDIVWRLQMTDPSTGTVTDEDTGTETGVTTPLAFGGVYSGSLDVVTKGTSGWHYAQLTLNLRMKDSGAVVVCTADTIVNFYGIYTP